MKLRTGCTVLLMLMIQQLAGQQFGGFPPSTKWKQIDSDTARIIFTQGAELQAARIATLIHRAAADTALSLGNRLRKVNIVLQSRTTLANGYVALAPFRSEFYLVPGSNLFDFGNLAWHDQLALHEYRHVQQYNNFRHGLSKGFGILFGEQGIAFANAITIPDWFFEGDAVHAETALTPQGRGRLPYFLNGFNSLWLENKRYSWQKLRNGSLKDYVPSHYQLGYLLANYGYLKYGDDFWQKVTSDASAFKGIFYPFQKAIKRHSGLNYRSFRNEAFRFYQSRLGTVKDETVIDQKTGSNHYFPQFIGTDSLLYLKSAYNKIPAFYPRRHNDEQKIAIRHISSEEWFGYRKGRVVYTAYSTNPRWSLVDYSDLVLLDLTTGRQKHITKNQRYYSPDFSPSGNQIIAVRINDSLQTELQVLDMEGTVRKSFPSERQYFYTNPRYIDEERVVVGTRLPDATMALQILNLSSGEWQQLHPFSHHTFSLPFANGNTVYFTSNINGNDDLFAIRLKDKKIYQLTNEHSGNYYASVTGDTVVWSHFTAEGLQLRKADINTMNWAEVNALEVQEQRSLYPVAFEHNIIGTRTERFSSKRYPASTGLFNFHSWAPSYADPELMLSLYSNNILNTFSNQLYYRYNQNERSHAAGWNLAYGGWYPVISGGLEYTYNRHIGFGGSHDLTADQLEARLGYNIPLNFTAGKLYRLLNFGSDIVLNNTRATGFYKDSFEANTRTYLHHYFTWQHYRPRAVQHIYPKFGYTLTANLRHFIREEGSLAQNAQWLLNAQLFLPSIRNHSLVLTGSFQSVDTNSTSFSNRFSNSRGYYDYYFRKMWKLSGNYHFPIVYPDFGIASIVYFQRLRGNVFFDYTKVFAGYFGAPPTASRPLKSIGGELFFDTKWWNQLPVSFGIRLSHLLDNGFRTGDEKGRNYFEVVLPVGLIPN